MSKMTKSNGFTLIEFLLLLAVIGALVYIVGPKFKQTERETIPRTLAQKNEQSLQIVRNTLQAYKQKYQGYPPSLDDVDFVVMLPEMELPPLKNAKWQYYRSKGVVQLLKTAPKEIQK